MKKIITGIKRISKPGLRVYANKNEIPKVLEWFRNSNPFYKPGGIITDKEARKLQVGGEVLAFVW